MSETNIRKGDKIYFGRFPKDNDKKIEPIEWDVLKKRKDEILIISHFILWSDIDYDESTLYQNSFIRRWLNDDFYNKAFDDKEKKVILISEVENRITEDEEFLRRLHMTPTFQLKDLYDLVNDTTLKNTQDKLFILSPDEVVKYFKEEEDRKAKETGYSRAQGDFHEYNNSNCWALRERGMYEWGHMFFVSGNGLIESSYDDHRIGIRPVMRISLILLEEMKKERIRQNELKVAEQREQEVAEQKKIEAEKKRLEELRIASQKRLELMQLRRMSGRCQYCGAKFKGFFKKKCANCGRKKDY